MVLCLYTELTKAGQCLASPVLLDLGPWHCGPEAVRCLWGQTTGCWQGRQTVVLSSSWRRLPVERVPQEGAEAKIWSS